MEKMLEKMEPKEKEPKEKLNARGKWAKKPKHEIKGEINNLL